MTRFIALGSAAVLALAACGAPPPEPADAPAEPAAPTSPVEPGAPVSAAEKLTAQGFGPLRIGMTRAEVEAALGPDADPEAVGGPDPDSCDMFRPERAPEGLLVMIEDGVLTSVWLSRNTAVETDRALNIGDTAAEVKRVYGAAAEVEPHKYVEAPAEYITVWSTADHQSAAARGLKYEIGMDGRVQTIAGGGPSIQYVEGCL
ncbi:hypothetical protein N0B44_20355 [Roseibacterium beibuensis]|uniref:hypothetical protein n=1 Tax=[Roseibacterium] beibuensis TaxID=1193142 RepID=UPI00217DFD00|nr:hypothetical protein [Roseibacterium beibuensis]MCS6625267.1 hypothetical protein [Roseibacterium beibuensis]